MGHHEDLAGGARRREHGVAILEGEGHRLLHQHVEPALQGGHGGGAVQVGGQADVYGVDLAGGEQVTIVAEPEDLLGRWLKEAVEGTVTPQEVGADVRHGHDLRLGHLRVACQVVPADAAQTDDPHS